LTALAALHAKLSSTKHQTTSRQLYSPVVKYHLSYHLNYSVTVDTVGWATGRAFGPVKYEWFTHIHTHTPIL